MFGSFFLDPISKYLRQNKEREVKGPKSSGRNNICFPISIDFILTFSLRESIVFIFFDSEEFYAFDLDLVDKQKNRHIFLRFLNE